MKFTVNRTELLAAAQNAERIAPRVSAIEILQCAYLQAEQDTLTVASGNLEIGLEQKLPANIQEEGCVVVKAPLLSGMLRLLDGERVTFQMKSGKLVVSSGNAEYAIPVKDAAQYPRMEIPCPAATVPVSGIPSLTKRTAFAVSEDKCVKQVKYAVYLRNTRPEYQGVLFQNKHIWALEGHRAGCCDDGGLNVEKSFTVGVPALEQLKAFGDADMQISVADNWVLFQNEHVRLLAKRILNVTPMTYESVVPQKWNEEFCFHRKDFVQALKYLLACTGKADKPYARFHNGTLSLRVSGCLYKAAVPISAESSTIFGFDARFMLDALTQFEKQDMVTMQLTGSLGAISLVAGSSSAIVLPVRLKEDDLNAA